MSASHSYLAINTFLANQQTCLSPRPPKEADLIMECIRLWSMHEVEMSIAELKPRADEIKSAIDPVILAKKFFILPWECFSAHPGFNLYQQAKLLAQKLPALLQADEKSVSLPQGIQALLNHVLNLSPINNKKERSYSEHQCNWTPTNHPPPLLARSLPAGWARPVASTASQQPTQKPGLTQDTFFPALSN